MADLATLETRLAEAELAHHKLLTGTRLEELEHGDMRSKYSSAATALRELPAYIAELKRQIAELGGDETLRRRGLVIDL